MFSWRQSRSNSPVVPHGEKGVTKNNSGVCHSCLAQKIAEDSMSQIISSKPSIILIIHTKAKQDGIVRACGLQGLVPLMRWAVSYRSKRFYWINRSYSAKTDNAPNMWDRTFTSVTLRELYVTALRIEVTAPRSWMKVLSAIRGERTIPPAIVSALTLPKWWRWRTFTTDPPLPSTNPIQTNTLPITSIFQRSINQITSHFRQFDGQPDDKFHTIIHRLYRNHVQLWIYHLRLFSWIIIWSERRLHH